jgi:outer membrane protein OmpU
MAYGKLDAAAQTAVAALEAVYDVVAGTATLTNGATLDTTAAVAGDIIEINNLIQDITNASNTAATAAAKATADNDLANAKAIRALMITKESAAVAKVDDSTDAVNRMRVTFTGSGETDSGLSFGATIRADNSGAGAGGTGGSQYISGAFGKVKMGDLGGADKDAAGHIAGVGLTGLGDHNEITYQAGGHNIGYEYSTMGLTFGYSQDTTVKTGSNSAMGVKYSGDMGGATVTVGVGQSKVGTATQSTMSAAVSSGGLTLKAITSSNDNGSTAAVTAVAADRTVGAEKAYVSGVALKNNADTDFTGVSVSYAMDAMSVTAFTKTVATVGAADKDYSGFGFAYDLGGVSLKAGVVDNNDQQLLDFGLSFSF